MNLGDKLKLINGQTLFIIEIDPMDGTIWAGETPNSKTGWVVARHEIASHESS